MKNYKNWQNYPKKNKCLQNEKNKEKKLTKYKNLQNYPKKEMFTKLKKKKKMEKKINGKK